MPGAFEPVARDVFRLRDTCNVYLLRAGAEATLVDFGAGEALDRLADAGVERVTDVVVTHHHRDQVEGLRRAADAGIRIWAPPVERDLIAGVDRHWQARPLDNDHDLRQDRFSLLEAVRVTGTVEEYRTRRYGGVELHVLPTPGHTVGSVSYLLDGDEGLLAFTGDLLYGPGKVWSLAATQWSYTGWAGLVSTIVSCAHVRERQPALLLPSHGEPIADPAAALALTEERLGELVEMRGGPGPREWGEWARRPWEHLSEHLLRNLRTEATCYALLSETGGALLFDYGYDLVQGFAAGNDRASRRPLLASVEALHREHGVERVEVVVPTHFHGDHVAGIELVHAVEGAEVWAPENVAPVLEEPHRFDLPYLWYDPVPVDRRLPAAEPVRWHEYELTAYPQPGHTLYAAAILVEVDGRRVLVFGDQQAGELRGGGPVLNFQYRNGFRADDYVNSARLYRELRPDLMLGGHAQPLEVTETLLDTLLREGERLARIHREVLPEEGFGPIGFGARIEPYRSTARAGGHVRLDVTVRNPFGDDGDASVRLVVPEGWRAEPAVSEVRLPGHAEASVAFTAHPGRGPVRRARVAAELTVDGVPFGQQAEALVDVV